MEVFMFSSQSLIRFGTMAIQPIPLSPHAEVRQEQRGIHWDKLVCLLAYGDAISPGKLAFDVFNEAAAIDEPH
jgi:hypothetical protein